MEALTADMTSDARIAEAPHTNNVTGYGPKIPIGYMFRIANRWHRVYVMNYGNSGSAYVVLKGKDYFLAGSAEFVLETIRDGGSYADAVSKLADWPAWMKESEADRNEAAAALAALQAVDARKTLEENK